MRLIQYIKSSLLIFALLACGISLFAQDGAKKDDIQTVKIAYITQALDLSADEATSFWPVYNEYHKERIALKKADEGVAGKEKMMDLDKAYIKDLKGILSTEKVDMVFKAEEDFKKMLLEELKKRSPER